MGLHIMDFSFFSRWNIVDREIKAKAEHYTTLHWRPSGAYENYIP